MDQSRRRQACKLAGLDETIQGLLRSAQGNLQVNVSPGGQSLSYSMVTSFAGSPATMGMNVKTL